MCLELHCVGCVTLAQREARVEVRLEELGLLDRRQKLLRQPKAHQHEHAREQRTIQSALTQAHLLPTPTLRVSHKHNPLQPLPARHPATHHPSSARTRAPLQPERSSVIRGDEDRRRAARAAVRERCSDADVSYSRSICPRTTKLRAPLLHSRAPQLAAAPSAASAAPLSPHAITHPRPPNTRGGGSKARPPYRSVNGLLIRLARVAKLLLGPGLLEEAIGALGHLGLGLHPSQHTLKSSTAPTTVYNPYYHTLHPSPTSPVFSRYS